MAPSASALNNSGLGLISVIEAAIPLNVFISISYPSFESLGQVSIQIFTTYNS